MQQVSGVRELIARALDGDQAAPPSDVSLGWVAVDACTLPSAEQPLRVAEFDELFATSLRAVTEFAPTRLRLELDASAEARVRDLAARESGCCSFFAFTIAPSGQGTVLMDVAVPPERSDVLTGLAARARRRAPSGEVSCAPGRLPMRPG